MSNELAFYDDSAQGWKRALYAFLGVPQRAMRDVAGLARPAGAHGGLPLRGGAQLAPHTG